MKNIYSFYLLLLSAIFVVSCGSTPVQEEVVEEPEPEAIEPIAELTPQPIEEVVEIDSVFYFDFDKSIIKPQAYSALDQHAEVIKRNIANDSSVFVIIEGHCDERGTEEYNIALGERRAQAVSRYLRVQGVPADNIETTSYGELDPVNPESNEDAWAENRRAVLVY